MERVEELLSAMMPALEAKEIGDWEPSEVELLCSALKEYGSQARASRAKKPKHSGSDAEKHIADGDAEEEEEEEEEEDEEEEDEEALFVEAIGEVDEGLERIRDFLRSRLPYGATPEPTRIPGSETTEATSKKRRRSPDASAQHAVASAALVPAPVYAVDSFLYSEDDIEKLVEEKRIAREYCMRCGCTDIRLSEFITHSFSKDQLLFLSCFLFPHLLRCFLSTSAKERAAAGKSVAKETAVAPLSVVDVGSRLGVVLWACAFALQQGALIQPPSEEDEEHEEEEPEVHITGVEMDEAYVKVSQEVLKRFFVPRRRRAPQLGRNGDAAQTAEEAMDISAQLHLVQSNCFEGTGAETLSQASLVVLHNVFEYFSLSPVEHARCWLKLRRLVCQRGQILVCSPALEETLAGFTADVWAAAWSEETEKATASAGAVVPPLEWLASFVERVDVSEAGSNFLTMRALSREEKGDEDEDEDGNCGHDHGDCGHDHGHGHHGHSHGHCHSHGHGAKADADDGADGSDSADEEASEVAEEIQKIHVYRVL